MGSTTHHFWSTSRWALALAALAVMFAVPGSVEGHHRADHQRGPRAGTVVENQFIVVLTRGASADAVKKAHDVRNPKSYSAAFNGFAGEIPPGRLRALQTDPRVEAVIPDRTMQGTPGRPGKATKTTSTSSSEIVPEGVKRIGAAPANSLGVTGAGVGVAVIDSGIDLKHIDLNVSSTCFDAFGGDCLDGSGHAVGPPMAEGFVVERRDERGGGDQATEDRVGPEAALQRGVDPKAWAALDGPIAQVDDRPHAIGHHSVPLHGVETGGAPHTRQDSPGVPAAGPVRLHSASAHCSGECSTPRPGPGSHRAAVHSIVDP